MGLENGEFEEKPLTCAESYVSLCAEEEAASLPWFRKVG